MKRLLAGLIREGPAPLGTRLHGPRAVAIAGCHSNEPGDPEVCPKANCTCMRGCQGPPLAPREAETCRGPVRQLASGSCGLAAGPQGPEMSEGAGTPVIRHMEAGEGRREKKGKRCI